MTNTYIITGATGFLGEQLTKKILNDGGNVILVGKSKEGRSFEERVRTLFSEFNKERIKSIEIDLSNISTEDLIDNINFLNVKISGVWHLAANLSFKNSDRDKVYKTNIDGLNKVISLAKFLNTKLFYTSTAYVHGRQTGVSKEVFLNRPKKFNNPYEESKYLAELIIKNSPDLKFVIFRPSIMYDRKVEYITNFGYYSFLIALFKIKKSFSLSMAKKICIPFPFLYYKKSYLNLMPSDIALDWMYKISNEERSLYKIFHICNPKPFSTGDVFKQTFQAFNISIPLVGTSLTISYTYFLLIDILSYLIRPLRPVAKRIYYFKWYLLKYMSYDMSNTQSILGNSIYNDFSFDKNHIFKIAKSVILKIESNKKND